MFGRLKGWTAALLLAVIASATPAHADWLKAESERFIVYSDGPERPLREFTQKLETFDRLLRMHMGLPLEEAPHRKLPIYLVRSPSGLAAVRPGIQDEVAGFYHSSGEDIFAIATQSGSGLGADDVLLHEYAHHFMMQHFPYPYPAWFIEGFAEYYMTAEIRPDRVLVGKYNANRASWITDGSWMLISDLLSSRPLQRRVRNSETFYPLSWLLTHWFMGDADRRRLLHAYLLDVGAGGDSIEAMERVTGMNMTQLRRTLRAYRRIPYQAIIHPFPTVPIEVTSLPSSANDLLLLNQRLKVGVPADRRANTIRDVRRVTARHPNDPLALLVLGHGELHFGEREAGRAALNQLLAVDPDHVEAMQLLVSDLFYQMRETEDPDAVNALRGQARALLARAYRVDDANYTTLLHMSELRNGVAGWPNENDIATLRIAYTLAPQLTEARLNLATALIAVESREEAIALLAPLSNSPHGGEGAEAARRLINQARGVTDEEAEAAEEASRRRANAEEDETGGSPIRKSPAD